MVHILSIAVFTKNGVYIYIQKQDLKNSKKNKIIIIIIISYSRSYWRKSKILAFSSPLREKKKDINHSHLK